jgi:hypothetical protein
VLLEVEEQGKAQSDKLTKECHTLPILYDGQK